MRKANQALLCTLLALGLTAASGVQALPRGVYKCVENERVAYQAGPCPEGAVQTPARRAKQTQEQRETTAGRTTSASELAARDRIMERHRRAREAQERRNALPKLDVEASCEDYARAGGARDASLYNLCINTEQAGYEDSAKLFGKVSKGMQDSCVDYARTGAGGSYSMLALCLKNELEAVQNPAQFKR